jgi:hypothetical protein
MLRAIYDSAWSEEVALRPSPAFASLLKETCTMPVCIRVTKAEIERWRAAAAKDGRTLSNWIRVVVNRGKP